MRRRNNRVILIVVLIFIFFLLAYSVVNKEQSTEIIQTEQDDLEIYTEDTKYEEPIEEIEEQTEQLEESIEETEEVIEEPEEESTVSEVSIEIPADEDLVLVSDYIPSIYVELKYATEDNFTGTVIYDFTEAYLRYGTVKKLAAAQEELLSQGYSLKIWDAYRPVSAQFVLWDVYPDSTYVANPNTGSSSHNRGNAVDVTLVNSDGTELLMPTGFDDFSTLADRDYSDVSSEASSNAMILENAMIHQGFNGYVNEWWHYSDSTDYPVIEE